MSLFDITKAYLHFPSAEDTKQYIGIASAYGDLLRNSMPFGLANAPAWFQRHMYFVQQRIKDRYHTLQQSKRGHIDDQYNTPIRAYLDDILITAPTKESHNLLMEATTDILAEDRFTVNPGKCFIGYHNIQILGHILGKSQIKPTNKRLQLLQQIPLPKTITAVRHYLVSMRYKTDFVPQLATLLASMDALIKAKGKPAELVTPVKWTT